MVKSNIPEYDLLFDFGKKKLVKVRYIEYGIYSTLVGKNQSRSNISECDMFDLDKVENNGMWYIIPPR